MGVVDHQPGERCAAPATQAGPPRDHVGRRTSRLSCWRAAELDTGGGVAIEDGRVYQMVFLPVDRGAGKQWKAGGGPQRLLQLEL